MSYPITVTIEPQTGKRNRLTTLFRVVLAIPHLILVGGPMLHLTLGSNASRAGAAGGANGLLGAAVAVLAIVSWFSILLTGQHYPAIRQFTELYMRWRVRSAAYLMLLSDTYPPFGDGAYPTSFEATEPGVRDKTSVGLRIFAVLPHLVALFFIMMAWWVMTFIAWVAILVTGEYPPALASFSVGVLRWVTRVEGYLLLLVDEYPPFSLE